MRDLRAARALTPKRSGEGSKRWYVTPRIGGSPLSPAPSQTLATFHDAARRRSSGASAENGALRNMVLVDTSVWIRFLSGREPYRGEIQQLLLEGDQVVGHDL